VVVPDHQWLIIELDDNVNDVSYNDIERAIINIFGDGIDYFIPIHNEKMGSYISTSVLMEGYIFLKDSDEVRNNIINLRDERLFSGPLFRHGKYQTIPSKTVLELKKKLKNSVKRRFPIGTKVNVLDGIFKGMVGEVVGSNNEGKEIVIKINLISREIIAPVPSTLIEEIQENGTSDNRRI